MFGGVVWAIGGYTLSTTNLLTILFAIAALPAVLAFGVAFLFLRARPRPRGAASA